MKNLLKKEDIIKSKKIGHNLREDRPIKLVIQNIKPQIKRKKKKIGTTTKKEIGKSQISSFHWTRNKWSMNIREDPQSFFVVKEMQTETVRSCLPPILHQTGKN